jgi:hypothetical protein
VHGSRGGHLRLLPHLQAARVTVAGLSWEVRAANADNEYTYTATAAASEQQQESRKQAASEQASKQQAVSHSTSTCVKQLLLCKTASSDHCSAESELQQRHGGGGWCHTYYTGIKLPTAVSFRHLGVSVAPHFAHDRTARALAVTRGEASTDAVDDDSGEYAMGEDWGRRSRCGMVCSADVGCAAPLG